MSNHLSDDEHARLHRAIERAAKGAFGDVEDFEVEDWLDTETMYRTMKGRSYIEWADYRCDTDRTMFGVLSNLILSSRFLPNLEAFRQEVEPLLGGFQLSPDYSIDTLSKMTWDAEYVLHSVLGKQLSGQSVFLIGAKVFKRTELDGYLEAVRALESDYFNFGLDLFERSLQKCNVLLQGMYASLEFYLKRARAKSSERYELSSMLHRDIAKLIASL